jgi:ankyrin repeat protein
MQKWPSSDDFPLVMNLAGNGEWDAALSVLIRSSGKPFSCKWGNRLLCKLAELPGSHDVLRLLIEHGADACSRDPYYGSPICNAISGGSRYGENTLEELKVLLQSSRDLNSACEAGYPPLHWSIVQNKLEHAKCLLEFGADPYKKTSDLYPENAFETARRVNNHEAIKLLDLFKRNS